MKLLKNSPFLALLLLSGCVGNGTFPSISALTGNSLFSGNGFIPSTPLVSDELLRTKAGHALGTDTKNITIVNKWKESASTTRFNVRKGKKRYQCYITSSLISHSSALCSAGSATKGKVENQCNALLKAANKC